MSTPKGFGQPRSFGFGPQFIGMSIASCVLNQKPTVTKQPSKPVFLNLKAKRTSSRGLVQRLRSLTSGSVSNFHKRQEPHDRMTTVNHGATSARQTNLSDHPATLLLATRSSGIQLKPKPKSRPKPKPKPKRKVLQPKTESSAQTDEEARQQQEMFRKKTQERVLSARRAKKKEELLQAQQRQMDEANKTGVDPAVLVKKVNGRYAQLG